MLKSLPRALLRPAVRDQSMQGAFRRRTWVDGAAITLLLVVLALEGAINAMLIVAGAPGLYVRTLIAVTLSAPILLYRWTPNSADVRVLLAFGFYAVVVTWSSLVNGVSVGLLLSAISPIVVAMVFFIVCDEVIGRRGGSDRAVLRILKLLAYVQAPIILIQRAVYPFMPASFREVVAYIDVGTGTFDLNSDFSLGLFCIGIIVLAMTRPGRALGAERVPVALAASIAILLSNAEFFRILLALILSIRILLLVRTRHALLASLLLLMASFASWNVPLVQREVMAIGQTIEARIIGEFGDLWQPASETVVGLRAGQYARSTFIGQYLWYEPLKMIGEGPGTFRARYAPMGHIYQTYFEFGVVGLVVSLVALAAAFVRLARRSWIMSVSSLLLIGFAAFTTPIYTAAGGLLSLLLLCAIAGRFVPAEVRNATFGETFTVHS